MGWDGNKLHYYFNGTEIQSENNNEYAGDYTNSIEIELRGRAAGNVDFIAPQNGIIELIKASGSQSNDIMINNTRISFNNSRFIAKGDVISAWHPSETIVMLYVPSK